MNVLRDLCEFTGYNGYSDDQIVQLRDHLSIDSMRKAAMDEAKDKVSKEQRGQFYRKGKVGDWKNHFDDEKLAEWNKWIEENLQGTDIKMQFE